MKRAHTCTGGRLAVTGFAGSARVQRVPQWRLALLAHARRLRSGGVAQRLPSAQPNPGDLPGDGRRERRRSRTVARALRASAEIPTSLRRRA
eukprot:5184894-Prymnesium_polylepis.1